MSCDTLHAVWYQLVEWWLQNFASRGPSSKPLIINDSREASIGQRMVLDQQWNSDGTERTEVPTPHKETKTSCLRQQQNRSEKQKGQHTLQHTFTVFKSSFALASFLKWSRTGWIQFRPPSLAPQYWPDSLFVKQYCGGDASYACQANMYKMQKRIYLPKKVTSGTYPVYDTEAVLWSVQYMHFIVVNLGSTVFLNRNKIITR